MSKFLITGGLGFIGSRLTETLIVSGHTVRVMDTSPHAPAHSIDAPFEFINASTADAAAMERAFDGADICVHLAGAPTDHDPRNDGPDEGVHLAQYASSLFMCANRAGNIPVIYASSAAIYGAQPPGLIKEIASCHPANAHGEEKLLLETAAQTACHTNGVPSVGLRFFNLYGPTQSPKSMYCGAPRKFIEFIRTNQPIPLFGGGHQIRDYTHIDDAIAGLMCVIEQPIKGAQVFNICTGIGISIRALGEMVAHAAERDVVFEERPIGSNDVEYSVGDPSKASEFLGFTAKVGLSQGINDMVSQIL